MAFAHAPRRSRKIRRNAAPIKACVIIPAYNEAAAIASCIAAARVACPGASIVVADSGTDETGTLAEALGAAVVSCRKGRGHQQNAGAQTPEARAAEVLIFLHADTLLPQGAGAAMDNALHNEQIIGGNFRLAFAPPVFWNRVFAWVYNARSQKARHYYGDSVLWVRRSVFDELGGFREKMLMEDWEFVCRLEQFCLQHDRRTVCLPLTVKTSARRFMGRRRLRYVFLWVWLHFLHAWGISGDRLAQMYPDTR